VTEKRLQRIGAVGARRYLADEFSPKRDYVTGVTLRDRTAP